MTKSKVKAKDDKEENQLTTDDIPTLPDGIDQYDPLVDDAIRELRTKFRVTPQEAIIAIRGANKFSAPKYGHVEWAIARIARISFTPESAQVFYSLPILDGRYSKQTSSAVLDDFPERFWYAVDDLYPQIRQSLLPIAQFEEMTKDQSTIIKLSFKTDSLGRRGLSIRFKAHLIDKPESKQGFELTTPWTFNKPESPEADAAFVHSDKTDAAVRMIISETRTALAEKYSGSRA